MASEKPRKPAGKRSADDKPAFRKGGAGNSRSASDKPARGGAPRKSSSPDGDNRSARPSRGGAPGSRGASQRFAPGTSTGRGYKRPGDDFDEYSEKSYKALEEGGDSSEGRSPRDLKNRFDKRKTPFSKDRDQRSGEGRPFKPRGESDRPYGDKPAFRKPFRADDGDDRLSSDRKPARGKNTGARGKSEPEFDTRKPTGYKSKFAKKDTDKPTDRRAGSFSRDDDRPRKSFGGDREDRGPRKSFGGDREERGPRKSFGSDREERGPRKSFDSDGGERAPRKPFGRDNDNADRGPRKSFGSDREERAPRKSFGADREERAPRKSFGSDREDRGAGKGKPDFKKKALGENSDDRRPARGKKPAEIQEAPTYNLRSYEKNFRSKKTEDGKEELIRLNRYIANAGVCARREADELIAAGEIKVNGEVVTEMGYLVKPSDSVQYGKKVLNREKTVYVLLNKPKGFITTTEDPEERKTVMELIANASKERIFPVGRLDRNTTGLLLFTNDGELAQKLSHPSHSTSKVYQIELDKPLTEEDEEAIKAGLELEDGKAEVDDMAILAPDRMAIGLEIHIGRNRIVRRIFEHLGYEVVKLDRVSYAGLTKKDLSRGDWRYLTEKEVIRLKYFD